jgi:hypothetical protein
MPTLAIKNEKMNVYLVRSKEMPIGMFNGVAEYLKQFDGPIEFNYDIEEVPEDEEEIFEQNVELIKYTIGDYEPKYDEAFNHYFQQCQIFRNEKGNIDSSDLVILLTNERNENNYFGYCDSIVKNVFIQCSNWNFIFGEEEFNPTLAISYEVIAWTLRSLIFRHKVELTSYVNPIPKGCIMDMCKEKKDISFKMRTGDISPSILELIRTRGISPSQTNQLFNGMEKIRSGIIFRDRIGVTNNETRLRVRDKRTKWELVLVDFGNLPVNFSPLQLTIYMVFLSQPGGIKLQNFGDENVVEFGNIFRSVYFSKDDDIINHLISTYTGNNRGKLLIENLTKINKKLIQLLPSTIVNKYLVLGKKNENYKISLNRDLVDLTSVL